MRRNLLTILCLLLSAFALLIFSGCGNEPTEKVSSVSAKIAATETKTVLNGDGPPPPVDFAVSYYPFIEELTFNWSYNNTGDYNLDGVVSGLDVFPLASRFNQESGHNGNTETTPGNNCIDGNMDGTLNGLDLFVCAANFQTRVSGWNTYRDQLEDGVFAEQVNAELIGYTPSDCGEVFMDVRDFVPGGRWYYAMRAYDGDADTEGELSDKLTFSYWSIKTIYEGVSYRMSMALSPEGHPYISFQNDDEELMLGRHDGTEWQFETVYSQDEEGQYSSLSFEGGLPAVSFSGQQDLKYARFDGTDWHVEVVDSTPGAGEYNSLAFEDGVPSISYQSASNTDLMYARNNGSAWNVELVDSASYSGGTTSLVFEFDFDDIRYRPAICYPGADENGLKIARHDGSNWNVETIDAEHSDHGDLALAPDGRLAVAYLDSNNLNLKYAKFDGSTWNIEVVDSEGNVGVNPSLAFDGDGHPAISYYDAFPNANLKFARHDGTNWKLETLDWEQYVGWCSSLGIASDGGVMIAYIDEDDYNLKFARYYN